jgi:hypothetical protein
MPDSLIVIISFTVVVIVGLATSLILIKDSNKRRASVAAFVSLLVLGALLYVVVVSLAYGELFPLFAGLCLIVPAGLYLIMALLSRKKSGRATKQAHKTEIEPRRAVAPQSEHKTEPVAVVSTPEPEPEPEPVAVVSKPEPEPVAVAHLPDDTFESHNTEFDDCYGRAESASQAGAYAEAGRLFEESIYLTKELSVIHKAIFSSVSAYLRAGMKDDVRRLAVVIQNSGTLSPLQEKKISTILKMLYNTSYGSKLSSMLYFILRIIGKIT